MKNFLGEKKSGELVSRKKKARTERVTGFGRRTLEEIVKWNQMTALRLQTGGRHQDIPGFSSGIHDNDTKDLLSALLPKRGLKALDNYTSLEQGQSTGNENMYNA